MNSTRLSFSGIVGFSALIGLASGLASAAFLWSLNEVTDLRGDNEWLLFALPVVGAAIAWIFSRYGGQASLGNRLTMAEIKASRTGVPLRLAPLALTGTLLTHLFGGSAGREGTALQMSAGLTDGAAKRLGFDSLTRRRLLIVALAGGFGSVFGVPAAGVVFALEVAPAQWRMKLAVLPAAVIASVLGHLTVGWVRVEHTAVPRLDPSSVGDLPAVMFASIAFGLTAFAFVRLTDSIRAALHRTRVGRFEPNPVIAPVIGGSAVVLATLAIGDQTYNGLSLPLLAESFTPGGVIALAFALKLILTSVTVGSGFHGGEVTPLFVIGATLGSVLAAPLGVPAALLASVGMMATFGAAANASLACIVMGLELFGSDALVPLLIGCLGARLFSGRRHLYEPADFSNTATGSP